MYSTARNRAASWMLHTLRPFIDAKSEGCTWIILVFVDLIKRHFITDLASWSEDYFQARLAVVSIRQTR
jgi:hypothetical protein